MRLADGDRRVSGLLLLALAAAALASSATVAWAWDSGIYRTNGDGRIKHFHTQKPKIRYDASMFAGTWVEKTDQAVDSWAANRSIDLPYVSSGEQIYFKRADSGANGVRVAWANGYHSGTRSVVDINSHYTYTEPEKRGRMCKAIGGILGLEARPDGDCMSGDPAANPVPNSNSQGYLTQFYGPHLSLGGPLIDNRTQLRTGQSYDLTAATYGHTVASVVVRLDGNVIINHYNPRTQCDDFDKDWCLTWGTGTVANLSQGVHILDATATNTEGFTVSDSRKLYVEYPEIGLNEAWTRWSLADATSAIQATADLGAKTDRLIVHWPTVIGSGWGAYDDRYNAMTARGIRPIVMVYDAPASWGPPGCQSGVVPPQGHNAEWSALITAAANRFPLAKGIQVWNEPNSRDYWGGLSSCVDPARYLELFALAETAIANSSNPSLKLVSAGLNPAVGSDKGMPWLSYLVAVASPGGSQPGIDEIGDAVGLHPYPLGSDCVAGMTQGQSSLVQVAWARAVAPGAPVWVTEVGASSADPLSTDPQGERCLSVGISGQPAALASIYSELQQAEVPVVIVHQLVDDPLGGSHRFQQMGITQNAPSFLQRKPAYWCLAYLRAYPNQGVTC